MKKWKNVTDAYQRKKQRIKKLKNKSGSGFTLEVQKLERWRFYRMLNFVDPYRDAITRI